jgi:hypothetical protein
MPSKFNQRRTTSSQKRRTPSRRRRSGSRGAGGGGADGSRSPPSSRKKKAKAKKHSDANGNPVVVFSDSQSTMKKDGVFLDAAASVRIVVYRCNKLARLQSTVQLLVHLRSLDLSHNHLASLPTKEVWSPLTRLAHLDLGSNRISQWENIIALSGLKSLISLVLEGNPLAMEQPLKYRHFVVNQVLCLKALDGRCIVDSEVIEGLQQRQQEQQQMLQAEPEPVLVHKHSVSGVSSSAVVAGSILGDEDAPISSSSSTAAEDEDEAAKPWTSGGMESPSPVLPLSKYLQNSGITGDGKHGAGDIQSVGEMVSGGGFGYGKSKDNAQTPLSSLVDATTSTVARFKRHRPNRFMPGSEHGWVGHLALSPTDSAQYMLQKLDRFLQRVRVTHSQSSALVCIQSFFRGHLARRMVDRQLKHGPVAATKMQAAFRGFLLRQSVEEDVRAILMQSESGKDLLVSEWDRLRIGAAVSIQRMFREWREERLQAQTLMGASASRPLSSSSSRALLLSVTPNWENPVGGPGALDFRPDSAQDVERMMKERSRDHFSRASLKESTRDIDDDRDSGFFARDSDSDADGFDFSSAWPAVAQQAWQPRPITIGVTTRPAKQELSPLPAAPSSKRSSTAAARMQTARRHIGGRRRGGQLIGKAGADNASSQIGDGSKPVVVIGQAARPSTSGPTGAAATYEKSELRDMARATRAESRAISQIRERRLMDDIAEYVLAGV